MDANQIAEQYLAVADEVFGSMLEQVETTAQRIAACLQAGGKVLLCGNGGSAADAQHIAGEFLNRFLKERRPYAAIALSTDTSTMTAIGNDYDFAQVFEKQVQALGRPGDVLWAISTSGNAENVMRAVAAARANGLAVIGMTGGAGGRLAPASDILFCLQSTSSTPRIQEGHQLLFHLICERLEEIMVASEASA
ncbi:MAG TPA: SIS domain-containing protein [Kiritimatiellia bacterium]|mgnify:CR=1 FL=1|nr:SIS domain-containing protein [Kiritimatiellia bacterium]HMO97943.1 SIS domain-containing protein [Kiritimatiellia bacterium]HMP95294.1 SIS domain-containing protein [Kiritimatiellia bacterium]